MPFDLGILARQRRPAPLPSVFATGGVEYEIIIDDVVYRVHEFTSSGTIRFAIVPGQIEYFVLSGGGGGGDVGSAAPAGQYQVAFNGTSQYLTTPANSNYNITGNFTVECWVYMTATGNNPLLTVGTPMTQVNYGFAINANSTVSWWSNPANNWNISNSYTTSATVPLNTWTHLAAVKNGSTFTIYINGTSAYSTNSFAQPTSASGTLYIATYYANSNNDNSFFKGRISNFRIVNGTAVYTGAFTTPSNPLTAITNTALLTCMSASFVDLSVNTATITPVNSPTISVGTLILADSTAAGGGGGAGGLLYGSGLSISPGIDYPIVVGAGGTNNTNGENSSFNNIVSAGGGRGGLGGTSSTYTAQQRNGAAGGSGGGGGRYDTNITSGGAGIAGQGNAGAGSSITGGGGGGGSNSSAAFTTPGSGIQTNWNGYLTGYADGGPGGQFLSTPSSSLNRGSGGAGGNSSQTQGGRGTAGVVYIRYPYSLQQVSPFVATGGNEVFDINVSGQNYRVHKFTSSGNLITNGGIPALADFLLVGSGGGGGLGVYAGGGGGGGLIYRNSSRTFFGQTYTVVIGAAVGTDGQTSGGNSTVFGLTALGGGRGGGNAGTAASGGSGGGGRNGSGADAAPGAGLQPSSASGGFGNNGGLGGAWGGGGGGAGAVGNNTSGGGGNGGNGLPYAIDGVSRYYAGGGGSGDAGSATYGPGLGGGTANFGGGGNGGTTRPGGRGSGPGIFIFRYPYTLPNQVEFASPGTYSWTAPANITSVSVACIGGGAGGSINTGVADGGGGGGLGWRNNITVTPGKSYTVVVGSGGAGGTGSGPALGQAGGDSYFKNPETVMGSGGEGTAGGTFVGNGGGVGGAGGDGIEQAGGGGGAGGYSGNGGTGGTGNNVFSERAGQNGVGGGAGGGAGGFNNIGAQTISGGGGGGVRLTGLAVNQGVVSGGVPAGEQGGGGQSAPGATAATDKNGAGYGGGGAGVTLISGSGAAGNGASGAVRIIWGAGRSYPGTSTQNV